MKDKKSSNTDSTSKTPSLTEKNRRRSNRYGGIAENRTIVAEYAPGRTPVIRETTEGMTDQVTLSNGKLISKALLTELQNRVALVIPFQDDAFEYKTEHFFRWIEWADLSNDWRRLLGMGLAYLVNHGLVLLRCINPHKSGTRIYRVKK